MPFLSFIRDDRVLVAGMGIAVISTLMMLGGMILAGYRDQNEILSSPPKTQYITQDTEDALKLSTLDTLLGHYNYSIRETAGRIVCDRAANDPSVHEYLVWGITRPGYEERIKCLKALAFITDHNNLRLMHTKKVCSALVRSLELCLSDVEHEKLDDKHFDEYYLRDAAEKLCLMFVSQLIAKFDARLLVETQFVEKWLAKQPWGDTAEERRKNYYEYTEYRTNRLREICRQLQDTREGRRALENAGLISRERAVELESGTSTNRVSLILEIQMPAGENEEEEEEDEIGAGRNTTLLERRRTDAIDSIRRQHREAMVLNDGTRPLQRDDIIESANRDASI